MTSFANGEVEEKAADIGGRLFRKRTAASFLVAFAILFVVIRTLDLDLATIWGEIQSANLPLYLLGFLVYYLTFPLRAYRWMVLLRNVNIQKSPNKPLPSVLGLAHIILLGWFGNCVAPAKLGDIYRGYLLKKESQVSFSSTMGTVLAERIIDMAVLFSLLSVAALGFIQVVNAGSVRYILLAGVVMLLLIGLGLTGMWGLSGRLQWLVPAPLKEVYGRFHSGTMGSFRQMPLVVGISVLVWLMETGRLFFVTKALGLSLNLPFVLFISLANSILTVVPFTPGGLGLVEAGVVGLLLLAPSVGKETAVSVAILDRTISYWSLVGVGAIMLLLGRRR